MTEKKDTITTKEYDLLLLKVINLKSLNSGLTNENHKLEKSNTILKWVLAVVGIIAFVSIYFLVELIEQLN